MAIGITLLGLLSLYGYLYGVPALYELKKFVPMSINTAFCFLLLGFGILFSRPDKGSMAVVIGESSGQIIFMRFIAFLLPLVYGYLKIKGEDAGLFSQGIRNGAFCPSYLPGFHVFFSQAIGFGSMRSGKPNARHWKPFWKMKGACRQFWIIRLPIFRLKRCWENTPW
jgi:hypothetical protein